MAIEHRRRAWTVDEYHRMGATGVLSEDDHTELIEGEIVEMSPMGRRHARCSNRLSRLLVLAAGERHVVQVAQPVQLSERTELEPDLSVLLWAADESHRAPTASDSLLVIEIADSSLRTDRGVKVPAYARAGVPEVWIVDLVGHVIEVHAHPSTDGYDDITVFPTGSALPVHCLPGVLVDVSDIVG